MLTKIMNTFNEILYSLLQNETICKLLYYDDSNALALPAPQFSINDWFEQGYVTNYFPERMDATDNNINNNIIFILDRVNVEEDVRVCFCDLFFISASTQWKLDNHQHRPLMACSEIIDVLNKNKFQSSGEIGILNLDFVSIGDFKSGYKIRLRYTDQKARKVEI